MVALAPLTVLGAGAAWGEEIGGVEAGGGPACMTMSPLVVKQP
jgi:hypothetical protein